MSVKVTCHYIIDTCIGVSCSGLCDTTDFLSGYCKDYIPKDNRIGSTCFNYKASEAVIHRTFRALEYEDGKGLIIGKEFIPCENIRYLALDYGNGEEIIINEREGETMKKELTFGEVAELLKKFEAEHPGAEKTELIAYAYEAGYKAGQMQEA